MYIRFKSDSVGRTEELKKLAGEVKGKKGAERGEAKNEALDKIYQLIKKLFKRRLAKAL